MKTVTITLDDKSGERLKELRTAYKGMHGILLEIDSIGAEAMIAALEKAIERKGKNAR